MNLGGLCTYPGIEAKFTRRSTRLSSCEPFPLVGQANVRGKFWRIILESSTDFKPDSVQGFGHPGLSEYVAPGSGRRIGNEAVTTLRGTVTACPLTSCYHHHWGRIWRLTLADSILSLRKWWGLGCHPNGSGHIWTPTTEPLISRSISSPTWHRQITSLKTVGSTVAYLWQRSKAPSWNGITHYSPISLTCLRCYVHDSRKVRW